MTRSLKPYPKGIGPPPSLPPFPFVHKEDDGPSNHGGDMQVVELVPSNCVDSLASFVETQLAGRKSTAKDKGLRKVFLGHFIEEMNGYGVVPSKYLKLALSKDELRALKDDIQYLKRPIPFDVKESLKEYVGMLGCADRLTGRRGGHIESTYVGLHPKRSLRDRAEAAYERALEHLEELVSDEPHLAMWLDRPVSFAKQEGSVSSDAAGVPRLKSSKSMHVIDSVEKAKRAAILDALRNSLAAIG